MQHRFAEIATNSVIKKKPTVSDKETYLGLEHLDAGTLTVKRFGSDVAPIGEKLVMKKGDVLFGKRRAYQKKVAIAPFDGIFSAHGMVLRPKEQIVDKFFFPLFISSDYFLDAAIKISVGSLSPTINWSSLKELVFELPPVDTQRKLAEVLWAAINVQNEYNELLSLIDQLIKSQFIEMFGDPVTNPMGWRKTSLEGCLDRIDSGTSLNCESYSRSNFDPAILKLSAVTSGCYDHRENKALPDHSAFDDSIEVHAGDLLFSRKNTLTLVGMSAYVYDTPPRLMLPDLIFRLVTKNNCSKLYLWQLINHPKSRQGISLLASGTASSMPNISKGRLMDFEIPLPPISLQNEFAAFVEQADKSKFLVERLTGITSLSFYGINEKNERRLNVL